MLRIGLEAAAADPSLLARIREILSRGGVAAVPTETFYGLAADPWSESGVRRIFRIKQRDDGKPLPVLAAGEEQLRQLGVDESTPALAPWLALWPAPLTVVLRIHAPIAASRGGRALAVRIPASTGLRRLLEKTGPLTGTSANRSGAEPLSDPDAVARLFQSEVDVLVDGGPTPGGRPSTIVDGTVDPPVLRRAGGFPWPPEPRGGTGPASQLC